MLCTSICCESVMNLELCSFLIVVSPVFTTSDFLIFSVSKNSSVHFNLRQLFLFHILLFSVIFFHISNKFLLLFNSCFVLLRLFVMLFLHTVLVHIVFVVQFAKTRYYKVQAFNSLIIEVTQIDD